MVAGWRFYEAAGASNAAVVSRESRAAGGGVVSARPDGPRAQDRGFTILELMMVVLIIAILITLAFPTYKMFRQNAYNQVAASDARQFVYAAEFASTRGPLPEPILLSGTGGEITGLPGATASPGTMGMIDVSDNRYLVEVYHVNGTLCYRYQSNAQGVGVVDISDCGGPA